jgi:hypothetical protein
MTTGAEMNISRVLPVLILSAVLLAGCASLDPPAPPPVRVPEILALSHESVPADDIIAKMRQSETVYRLTASQLAKLHKQGVPYKVINICNARTWMPSRDGKRWWSETTGVSRMAGGMAVRPGAGRNRGIRETGWNWIWSTSCKRS